MKIKNTKTMRLGSLNKKGQDSFGKSVIKVDKISPQKLKKSDYKESKILRSKSQIKTSDKKLPSTLGSRSHSSSKKREKIPKKMSKDKKQNIRMLQRQQMLDRYLRNKIINEDQKVESYLESTYSFQPANNDLQVDQTQHYQINASKHLAQSFFEIESKVISSYPMPDIYQNYYEESKEKKQMQTMQKRKQWQEFQTIKLKNQELTNYIEQLQKIQQKLIKQNTEQCLKIREEHQQQKKLLTKDIDCLRGEKKEKDDLLKKMNLMKEQSARILSHNATLQEMFNQGKNNYFQLQRKLSEQKHNFRALQLEKELLIKKYKESCQQKTIIKQRAQEILSQLRHLQNGQQDY